MDTFSCTYSSQFMRLDLRLFLMIKGLLVLNETFQDLHKFTSWWNIVKYRRPLYKSQSDVTNQREVVLLFFAVDQRYHLSIFKRRCN